MSSKFVLVCEVSDDGATVASNCAAGVAGSPATDGAGSVESILRITKYIEGQAQSGPGIKVTYFDTAVSGQTTGTFTGDPTAGQALTVNGVTFTARASGAVANEFNIAAGDVTTTAANLAASINASTTARIINTVGASSALGVVTIYSIIPGSAGIPQTVTENLDNFTLVATTLSTTGGTQAHNAVFSAGIA